MRQQEIVDVFLETERAATVLGGLSVPTVNASDLRSGRIPYTSVALGTGYSNNQSIALPDGHTEGDIITIVNRSGVTVRITASKTLSLPAGRATGVQFLAGKWFPTCRQGGIMAHMTEVGGFTTEQAEALNGLPIERAPSDFWAASSGTLQQRAPTTILPAFTNSGGMIQGGVRLKRADIPGEIRTVVLQEQATSSGWLVIARPTGQTWLGGGTGSLTLLAPSGNRGLNFRYTAWGWALIRSAA